MDNLSLVFGALSDPTRRAILARLAESETTVKELSKPFQISAPAITKHLKILERAGLITRGRDAQTRPCRLNPSALRIVAEWMEFYRHFWTESFDRLNDMLLEQAKQQEPQNGENRP